MITVYCICIATGKRFERTFYSLHAARVFMLRCKHGHRVFVEGYSTTSQACNEELAYCI